MNRLAGAALVLSGCSSILGIEDFKVGDAGAGNEMVEQGYCVGPMGWRVCLDAMPTDPRMVNSDLNFDTATSPLCATEQPENWMGQGQPPACFIIGSSVTLMASVVRATGDRPLVLLASDTITIKNQLDVASHGGVMSISSNGAGAAGAPCVAPMMANSGSSGGGGAGGAFMTKGGDGGNSTSGVPGGRSAAADATAPTRLRAGCPGGVGGNGNEPGGAPGFGGGAVYLVAGNRIVIDGFINASGAGGKGGMRNGGGGGGGSGGMIHLNAPTITGNGGVLIANGGGAGEGGDTNIFGAGGNDPSPSMPTGTPLGGTSTNAGGAGGNGYADQPNLPTSGTAGAAGAVGAGGGGGGGAGFIRVNVAPAATITASPKVTVIATP